MSRSTPKTMLSHARTRQLRPLLATLLLAAATVHCGDDTPVPPFDAGTDTGVSADVAADAPTTDAGDDTSDDTSDDVGDDDAQDVATDTTEEDVTPADDDEDGVENGADNCPDDPNPRQTDTDRDGRGNACDPIAWEDQSDDRLIDSIEALHDDTYNPPVDRYQTARRWMFEQIDNDDGDITGVYTGTVIRSFIEPEETVMNAEHTWPQSLGADQLPMRADLHHLFPALADANNARGSLPFCVVTRNVGWNQGGSKRGEDADGNDCFEPRDEHKGDAARAIFYFAATYAPTVDAAQEAVLRQWNSDFPPTEADVARNDAIEDWMGSRNPFVDYPDLVNRISNH